MVNVESVLTSDRISNLPNDVTENILMCLPIRDTVRTSILSRKWRHVWTKLPQLVLDKTVWTNVPEKQDSAKTTLMKVLYQLLLGHDGPIHKFTLSYPNLESCAEIDNMISFLYKSNIEDFTLEMWKDCYLLPYSIFSCQKLRHLSLRFCSVKMVSVIGFSRLTSLKLIEVTISAQKLARLISGSPLLAILEIEIRSGIDIRIDAPSLKSLTIKGKINAINLIRVPVLASVSIKLDNAEEFLNVVGVESNIIKFFDCLPALETLQLSYHVVRSILDEIPKRLPISLIHLRDLKLTNISFNHLDELLFILCLLRSSPILKYIEILFGDALDSNPEKSTIYMEGEDYSDICLCGLREVKLDHVTGTKPELEFIRLLVAKSSSLNKIQIHPKEGGAENGFKILKEVIKFRRLSEEAEIIFTE